MRTAIITLGVQGKRDALYESKAAEAEYGLALGGALWKLGYNPWIICNPEAAIATQAISIPRLCLNPGQFWGYLKLWQWQRGEANLSVLCLGQESLKLGRRLWKMGAKFQRQLIGIFFLAGPDKDNLRYLADAQSCFCGSSFIANDLMSATSQWKKPIRIRESVPGLDTSAFPPGTSWQEGSRFVFGMAGSLGEHSGALHVIRAMAALWQHDDLPPWEVRMFGSGPRFGEIMEEAEKLGVLSRLSILDAQPLTEVARHCHVWLAPGSASNEMPWVLWAGFASHIPVIATQSPIHRERIWTKDGVVWIASDNPQEMARAMLNMMREPALRAAIVSAAEPMLPKISLAGMATRICRQLVDILPAPQPSASL